MKNVRHAGLLLGLAFISLLIITFSCQKENDFNQSIPEGQQRVRIRLSDNPLNFDAVYVDIQKVEVLVVPDSCRGGRNDDDHGCYNDHHGDRYDHGYRCAVWDTLDIRTGVYNLLDLTNGADTLLATGFTIEGSIKKIRLTLGTQNSVVIDSVSYPLTFSNNNDRVTISVRGEDVEEISSGDLQLWLDFDAGRSIVRVNNNRFVIKPYLRIWLPAQTASLEGRVLPRNANAVVSAVSNGDTLIAIPDRSNGRFKIRGLRGTSANVLVNATANGYQDTMINNVALERGRTANIGTIQLRQ